MSLKQKNPITIRKDHAFVLSDNLFEHHNDSLVLGSIPNSSSLEMEAGILGL
jgi:hypothetical protein